MRRPFRLCQPDLSSHWSERRACTGQRVSWIRVWEWFMQGLVPQFTNYPIPPGIALLRSYLPPANLSCNAGQPILVLKEV